MKAIVYRACGPPDVLRWEEIEKPIPGDDEVLIQVRAASLNPLDWRLMRGGPPLVRLFVSPRGRPTIPGRDVAGEIEAVGGNVTQFKPGDAVFGCCRGACAEYATAKPAALVKKPERVTFEQAASVPIAGLTALQGLRDKGRLQRGETVLVNGAAGGVGTFSVQVGKWLGAEVTAVCSGGNAGLVRSIGADHVIDYAQDDFRQGPRRYDVILDNVGNLSLRNCRRLLAPAGRAVIAGAAKEIGAVLIRLAGTVVTSRLASRPVVAFMAKVNTDDLQLLGRLVAERTVTPVVDRCYPLDQVADALRHLETGHARGKVVITAA